MKIIDFLKDKKGYLLSHFVVTALIFLVFSTLSQDYNFALCLLVLFLYILGILLPLVLEFKEKSAFYENLIDIFDNFERKNLITEMISPPTFFEGIILYDVLKASNKAYLDEINKYKNMQEEYREYIELWVHEVKTPIASSKLLAQNNKNEITQSIFEELDKIDSFVNQALFYSRSNNVEKDYLIKEFSLQEVCFGVLKNNSTLLIHNKCSVITDNLNHTVFCDAKWLEFILNQLIINSVKYKSKTNSRIKLNAEFNKNNIVLLFSDNGIGIPENELPRIFDKGFTGSNGRKKEKSTGMGLYICKKLCDKLGLSISASSIINSGTTISIIFPINSMLNVNYKYNLTKM